MRLFVGVGVDERVRREAERVATELRRRLGTRLRVNWVAPENLHLTVRFIGHVPDDRVEPLVAALSQPFDAAACDVELSGCGSFPPRGGPRVIWIGLGSGLSQLAALHHECTRRLLPLGYAAETRAFSAHLTLARVKDAPAAGARAAAEALAACRFAPLVQSVDRLTIFESRVSSKGARYAALRELPLAPATC